jgi:hypothetical protein
MSEQKAPWWVLATTPKRAFLLAGAWALVGACQVGFAALTSDRGELDWLPFVVIALMLLLVTVYVASGVRALRIKKSDTPSARPTSERAAPPADDGGPDRV